MTTRIDLNPYIKKYIEKHASFNITYLPPVHASLPDGPTWYDRVKRAEHIADIVNRAFRHHQEEYEDQFLDLRDKFFSEIKVKLPKDAKLEGSTVIINGSDLSFLK